MANILILFVVSLVLPGIATLAYFIGGNTRVPLIEGFCDCIRWFTGIAGGVVASVALVCFVIKMLLGAF